ncbi:hypothetical protein PPACK8108_LOCUS9748 [Phakopsora pachyrhizi]|uniref:Uncharacterized protein n=1 Tax=Phakopsora pachyrhizi TaxID=170000 RepID=A0AAV0AX11_PHAPC|nr:hypothetical protein PPACK8108_LOCUS9748 [Phakopsora pachyrhizi]
MTYQSRYGKAKKESSSTGFGLTEEDQSKGIITISQKLNLMYPCYEQMDHIFGSLPNILSYLGEAAPTVIDKQLFRFPEEDDDIIEGEDIVPITNPDKITNDIPTSNTWNLNPKIHQETSKSALPPTTYAELYVAKTDCKLDYESVRISCEWEKWSLEGELQLKKEETTKDLEYQKLQICVTESTFITQFVKGYAIQIRQGRYSGSCSHQRDFSTHSLNTGQGIQNSMWIFKTNISTNEGVTLTSKFTNLCQKTQPPHSPPNGPGVWEKLFWTRYRPYGRLRRRLEKFDWVEGGMTKVLESGLRKIINHRTRQTTGHKIKQDKTRRNRTRQD